MFRGNGRRQLQLATVQYLSTPHRNTEGFTAHWRPHIFEQSLAFKVAAQWLGRMSYSRSSMPVRREHLINEYRGASDAAFAAIEQSEYFSSHARIAKANKDLRDEGDLWDAASHHFVNAIKHREHELLCRREEYRLYKQQMSELETKVQKSIMAYCRRRIYRMRRWEREQLECKASLVQLKINIERCQAALNMAEDERIAFRQDIRLNGSGRARVEAFGTGWERSGGTSDAGYSHSARVNNDAWTLRKMDYSISRTNSRIKSQQIEEELRMKAWSDAKDGLDAFKDEWRDKDNAARALLLEFERGLNHIEATAASGTSRMNALYDDDDDDSWEDGIDQALAAANERIRGGDISMQASGGSKQLPHNLLSPTPDDVNETTFQYAGMQLKDDNFATMSSGGMDSGYESGPGTSVRNKHMHGPHNSTSASLSSLSTSAASNLSYQTTVSNGWEDSKENISIEAGWQAAFDAHSAVNFTAGLDFEESSTPSSRTPRAASGNNDGENVRGNGGFNEWEIDYGQES